MRVLLTVIAALLICAVSNGQGPNSSPASTPTSVEKVDVEELKRITAEEMKKSTPRRRHFLLRPWLFNRPEARRLWLGSVPLAIGLILDCHSTALVGRRRPGAVETNPFLPAHPTNGQIAGYCGAYFIGQLYAQEALRSYSRGIERTGNRVTDYFFTGGGLVDAYSVGVGAIHGAWAARQNYNLVTCPSGFYKPVGQPGCVRR